MKYYLYPSGTTLISGTIGPIGAGTMHEAVDDPQDAISDSDYVVTDLSDGHVEYTLTAMTQATIVNSVKFTMRTMCDHSGAGAAYLRILHGVTVYGVIAASDSYGGGWTTRTATHTTNPVTGQAWTVADLLALKLRHEHVSGSGYEQTSAINLEVDYEAGARLDTRERGSRELRLVRVPVGTVKIRAPLHAADIELGQRFGVESIAGFPAGWGRDEETRRVFVLVGSDLDLDSHTVTLTGLDIRDYEATLWDGMISEETPAESAGIARVSLGAGRALSRQSKAWIESAVYAAQGSRRLVEIAANSEKHGASGEALEDGSTNFVLHSTFSAGSGTTFTGWTYAQTSGTLTEETSDLVSDMSARCPRFTAAASPAGYVELYCAYTSSFPAASKLVLVIEHKDPTGQGAFYWVQRSSDSYYLTAAGGTWGSTKVWNQTSASTSLYGRHNLAIDSGTIWDTLRVGIGLPTTAAASQANLFGYVGLLESTIKGRTPIHATTTTDHSGADQLRIENHHQCRSWPAQGSLALEWVPRFDAADMASGFEATLLEAWYDASNYYRLFYSKTDAAIIFRCRRAGTNYSASRAATPANGTAIVIRARWLGAIAEHGLAAYTMSLWLDGVKGTDAAPGGACSPLPASAYLRIGHSSGMEPTDISGCDMWLEADGLTGLNDGDLISTWTDLSGNGNSPTQTGAARPVYKTNILAAKPVVRFDGSSQYFALSALNHTSMTWLFICNPDVVSDSDYLIGEAAGASPTSSFGFSASNFIARYAPSSSVVLIAGATTGWRIYVVTNSGTTCQGLRYGTEDVGTPQSITGGYSQAMQIGAIQSGYFFDGDIAAIVAWNRILGMHEIHQAVRWAGNQYNLLPFGFGHADAWKAANGDLRYLTISPVCLSDVEIVGMA